MDWDEPGLFRDLLGAVLDRGDDDPHAVHAAARPGGEAAGESAKVRAAVEADRRGAHPERRSARPAAVAVARPDRNGDGGHALDCRAADRGAGALDGGHVVSHVADRWHATVVGRTTRTERYGCGARWRARVIDPDGRERSKVFDRKVDAERFLAVTATVQLRGEWAVDPALGRLTFAAYARYGASERHRRDRPGQRDDPAGRRLRDRAGAYLSSVMKCKVPSWSSSPQRPQLLGSSDPVTRLPRAQPRRASRTARGMHRARPPVPAGPPTSGRCRTRSGRVAR